MPRSGPRLGDGSDGIPRSWCKSLLVPTRKSDTLRRLSGWRTDDTLFEHEVTHDHSSKMATKNRQSLELKTSHVSAKTVEQSQRGRPRCIRSRAPEVQPNSLAASPSTQPEMVTGCGRDYPNACIQEPGSTCYKQSSQEKPTSSRQSKTRSEPVPKGASCYSSPTDCKLSNLAKSNQEIELHGKLVDDSDAEWQNIFDQIWATGESYPATHHQEHSTKCSARRVQFCSPLETEILPKAWPSTSASASPECIPPQIVAEIKVP